VRAAAGKKRNMINITILYALVTACLFVYVPLRLEGLSNTFWVCTFQFDSLGERGVLWHLYKIAQNMDWRYFLVELVLAYGLGMAFILVWTKMRKR